MFLIVLLILWNSSTIDCFFYCFVFTQDYLDRERFIHKRFTRLPTHSCHAMIVCGTINRSQKYKFGNLEIWKFGNLEIWKLKNKGSEKNKPSIFPPLFPNSSESGMVNLNKKAYLYTVHLTSIITILMFYESGLPHFLLRYFLFFL